MDDFSNSTACCIAHNCDINDKYPASSYYEDRCLQFDVAIYDMLACVDTHEEHPGKQPDSSSSSEADAETATSDDPASPTSIPASKSSSGDGESNLTSDGAGPASTMGPSSQGEPTETSIRGDGKENGDNGEVDSGSGGGRNDLALALGIGLGLGVPLTIGSGGLVIFLFWRTRRKDKKPPEGNQIDSIDSGERLEAADGKMGGRVISEVPTLSEVTGTERWSEVPTAQELPSEPRRISEMP